jgi:hypothetical protein
MCIDLDDDELALLCRHARRIPDDAQRDQFFAAVADRLRGQHFNTGRLHASIHEAKRELGISGEPA